MKNFFKFLGIISIALVIGFSMAGCKGDDGGGENKIHDDLIGTWKDNTDDSILKITSSGFDTGSASGKRSTTVATTFATTIAVASQESGTSYSTSNGKMSYTAGISTFYIFCWEKDGDTLTIWNADITSGDKKGDPAFKGTKQ